MELLAVHKKLGEFYNFINSAVDEVAEEIMMIGGKPTVTLKKSVDLSRLEESTGELIRSNEIYTLVLADFVYLLKSIIEIKRGAEEKMQYSVSILMDKYITEFTKSIWMMRRVLDSKKISKVEA